MSDFTADERQQQGEALLREANLLRVRREFAAAEERCRRAAELLPDDAGPLEMLGDLLEAQGGDPHEILRCYERALELAPGADSLEVKIARAILARGEEERLRLQADLLLAGGSFSPRQRKRQVAVAGLLSVVLPGAGQAYNRDVVKAAIIAPVWLMAVWLGYTELFKLFLAFASLSSGQLINGPAVALGLVGVIIHIYAVLDAASRADQLSGPRSGPAER